MCRPKLIFRCFFLLCFGILENLHLRLAAKKQSWNSATRCWVDNSSSTRQISMSTGSWINLTALLVLAYLLLNSGENEAGLCRERLMVHAVPDLPCSNEPHQSLGEVLHYCLKAAAGLVLRICVCRCWEFMALPFPCC